MNIEMVLCDRFPALSPFSVRRERLHDVLAAFVKMRRYDTEKSLCKANGGKPAPEGSFMRGSTLYVPAQNDDWF